MVQNNAEVGAPSLPYRCAYLVRECGAWDGKCRRRWGWKHARELAGTRKRLGWCGGCRDMVGRAWQTTKAHGKMGYYTVHSAGWGGVIIITS